MADEHCQKVSMSVVTVIDVQAKERHESHCAGHPMRAPQITRGFARYRVPICAR